MSQCYQQLAHEHRMVFIERTPDAPVTDKDWEHYAKTFGPALDGTLFSEAAGYRGTGMDTPVSIWRTPWPQDYDMSVAQPLDTTQLDDIEALADAWQKRTDINGWYDTRFFAYIFDEVDGPSDKYEADPKRRQYIARVHKDMQLVPRALGEAVAAGDTTPTRSLDAAVWIEWRDALLELLGRGESQD